MKKNDIMIKIFTTVSLLVSLALVGEVSYHVGEKAVKDELPQQQLPIGYQFAIDYAPGVSISQTIRGAELTMVYIIIDENGDEHFCGQEQLLDFLKEIGAELPKDIK